MKKQSGGEAMRNVWKLSVVLGCLLVAALVVVACSSGSSNMNASGMGTVSVSLSDPAACQAPSGPFAHVYVTVTDVSVNMSATASSTDSSWVDLTPKMTPMQIDLLGEANNKCLLATLGDALQLQAGTYQQIRLILASNSTSVTNNNCTGAANCVVLSSDPSKNYPLLLSSEAQTGIKIPAAQMASGGLTIAAGKTEDLDINFLTCESIVREGNGQYRLKPVLTAGVVSATSTSINGTVVDSSTGKPVDGTVFVAAEQEVNGVYREQMATTAGTDGSFVLCPLPAGTYNLVIVAERTADKAVYMPTIVTGVQVGDTTGNVVVHLPSTVAITTASNSTSVSLSGMVTSQNSSMAGTQADIQLSALETVNGNTYTIPMAPIEGNGMVTQSVETNASNPSATPPLTCPTGTDCANYTMVVPSGGAYYGALSSGSVTMNGTPSGTMATYVVDGMAFVPGTTTGDCSVASPQEVKSSTIALTAAGPFTPTPYPVPVPPPATALAFTSCQ